MTSNQIAYFKAREDARHNAETEEQGRIGLTETNRHNVETERIQHNANSINNNHLMRMDAETQRHNVASERETNRANVVKEAETYRHNVASEALNSRIADETNRHNLVFEAQQRSSIEEAIRHNKASESIGLQQAESSYLGSTAALQSAYAAQENAAASMRNALTNEYNANTNRSDMYTRSYSTQNEVKRTAIQQQNADTSRYTAQKQAERWQTQSVNETALVPYQKANLVTQSARNVVSAASDVINNIFKIYGGR